MIELENNMRPRPPKPPERRYSCPACGPLERGKPHRSFICRLLNGNAIVGADEVMVFDEINWCWGIRKMDKLQKEIAREHCEILLDALYKFTPVGGNLHIITDDGNVQDSDINFCRNYIRDNPHDSPKAQQAIEYAILDLLSLYDEKDREFILIGCNL